MSESGNDNKTAHAHRTYAAEREDSSRVCGERYTYTSKEINRWDHPRVCGEKEAYELRPLHFHGSPPRVRGKAGECLGDSLGEWITPACAGKRELFRTSLVDTRDHPRVCGEKFDPRLCILVHAGSPPRVRGKVSDLLRGGFLYRITPACAGKRACNFSCRSLISDHPRVCGEKTKNIPDFRHCARPPP